MRLFLSCGHLGDPTGDLKGGFHYPHYTEVRGEKKKKTHQKSPLGIPDAVWRWWSALYCTLSTDKTQLITLQVALPAEKSNKVPSKFPFYWTKSNKVPYMLPFSEEKMRYDTLWGASPVDKIWSVI